MLFLRVFPSLPILLSLSTTALSQSTSTALATNLNPSGTGCVDSSGYLSCYTKNTNDATACATACTNDSGPNNATLEKTCLDSCASVQLAANLGCWLTSCWNEVYSCAYQGTAIQYLDGTDRAQGSFIPFYPAPNAAPDGCVCNLGDYWGNTTVATDVNLCQDVLGTVAQEDCQCCFDSSLLSNVYNICPSNDLSALGVSKFISDLQLAYNDVSSNKCSILSNPAACKSSFSIDTYATTYVNPGALPSGFPGTASLSNTGSGSITSPGLGPTYVFSVFPAYTTTVVAAAYNAGDTGATGTSGTTSATATGVTSGSVTTPLAGSATAGSSATTTSKNSSAASTSQLLGGLSGVAMLAVMVQAYLGFA